MIEEYEKLLNFKQRIEFDLKHYKLSDTERELKKKKLEQVNEVIKEIERIR